MEPKPAEEGDASTRRDMALQCTRCISHRRCAGTHGAFRVKDNSRSFTFMTEVERILNDRPITPVSDNPDDIEALSPAMLLLGRRNPCLPPDEFMKSGGCKRSWRHAQCMTEQFRWRWMKEYLPTLQLRQKWHHPTRNFAVGDLILIVDEKTKRGLWPKGVIREVEVYPDSVGHVRRVRVRTSTSSYLRDIRKLCLLEGVEN